MTSGKILFIQRRNLVGHIKTSLRRRKLVFYTTYDEFDQKLPVYNVLKTTSQNYFFRELKVIVTKEPGNLDEQKEEKKKKIEEK